MSETQKRSLSKIRLFILAVLLSTAGMLPSHLSVTLSPSLSHRVFFLVYDPDHGSIRKGDYVLFDVQKEMMREIAGKQDIKRLLKIVGCTGGAYLTVVGRDYYCDDEYLGRAKDVSLSGKRASRFLFNGTIPEGSLFVIGQHKDSFDSRYFGFVRVESVIAKAYPLF